MPWPCISSAVNCSAKPPVTRGLAAPAFAVLALAGLLLAGCASNDSAPANYNIPWNRIPDAVPRPVTPSATGNPESYVVNGKTYHVMKSAAGFEQTGIASWYGSKFHGRKTSSGEDYDMFAMTAAHKTLPIPVYVEVTNLDNGRKAIVRVNDRGPFHEGRIIDLSYAAATRLGVAKTGTARVHIRVLDANGKPSSKPLVENPPATGGRVYVQVAAFATEENALQYLGRLQAEGFSDVRLHIESRKGRAVYRVRIGPLPGRYAAKKLLRQLEAHDHHNLKIITYN